MTILVLGASGATGKCLVEQLRATGNKVIVIIRPTSKIPSHWNDDANIEIHRKNVAELTLSEVIPLVQNCQAVASCLGHTMNLKGMYGKPKTFVSDTVQLFCDAIQANAPQQTVKFVLMNTIGFRNKDEKEKISFLQTIAMGLIRIIAPPHRDNELAAEYLRVCMGQNPSHLHWAVVRPDGLINEEKVTDYEVFPSPINTLFTSRKISRINVAHFMASLITQKEIWEKWKGKMPVLYNKLA